MDEVYGMMCSNQCSGTHNKNEKKEELINKTNEEIYKEEFERSVNDYVESNKKRKENERLTDKEIELYSRMNALDKVVDESLKRGDIAYRFSASGDDVTDHGKVRPVRLYDVIIARLGYIFYSWSLPLVVLDNDGETFSGVYTVWGKDKKDTSIMGYDFHID